jgi:autotransporter-associated beta strand protein
MKTLKFASEITSDATAAAERILRLVSLHFRFALFALGWVGALGSGVSVRAATTTSDWNASSAADYSVSGDWSPTGVPNGVSYYTVFNNGVTCDYTASDANYSVGGMFVGTNSNGSFNMSGGLLLVSNTAGQYILTLGGGYPGLAGIPGYSGGNGTFTMSGGTLTVVRETSTEQQDGFILGLGTNSTGTFSLSGGTATFLCGTEIGCYGAGTLAVSGGTLIDNGWFHIGQGENSAATPGLGSGTFNLSGGAVYVLPQSGTSSGYNGGCAIGQNVTNATANISGGALYCSQITFSGGGVAYVTNTLNMSGGTIYLGAFGVSSNVNGSVVTFMNNLVNISGGTFRSADFATNAGTAASNGNTNNILPDGTNWTWSANVPVNLTNSSFTVNGATGPGYVTFAPESTRTITLNNAWSGTGGFVVNGPGTVIAGPNLQGVTGGITVSNGTLAACGTIASLANFAQPGAYPTNYVQSNGTLFLATNLTTAGTLITSNLTVNGTLSVIINTSTTTGGTNSLLIVTNLTLGAGSVLNVIVKTTPTLNQPYVVAEYWGKLTGSLGTLTNTAGDTMTWANVPPSDGSPGEITVTVTGSRSGTFNWIANAAANFNVSSDWDLQAVPATPACTVQFTNGVSCNFTASDNYTVGPAILGPLDNSSGTVNMSGGTLTITNSADEYLLMLGGGGAGVSALTGGDGTNGSGTFNLSGGNLTVVRGSATTEHQDGFILGLGTNSTGTFSLSGGTATFLCGIEIGVEGAGTLTVSGGTLIANSWFHVGEGLTVTTQPGLGSGTFNLSGGAVYILPNTGGGPSAQNDGLTVNEGVTNATVNISDGTLYCYQIGMNGLAPNIATNALNLSGGTLYIGAGGVSSNELVAGSALAELVNISGGTFRTADFATNAGTAASNGNTNNILPDGTNWTWRAMVPVNLTNSSFTVNGVTGPGYVTFAPEANRTITLNNVWSGVGGMNFAGPGQVILAAANTYTGATTIGAGTLDVNASGSVSGNVTVSSAATLELENATALAAGATLNVASGAIVNLAYSGTDNIAALSIAGASQAPGVYGASASNPGGVFTGTGTVTIPGSAAYPTPGITSFSLSGTTLTISATNGLANGTYYVLESTNVALPVPKWNVVYTNSFNSSGNIVGQPVPVVRRGDVQEFFILLQSTNASAFP